VVVLILLSRLKHDIVQMTANFVDLMVIDRDTRGLPVYDLPQSALVGVIGAALVIIPSMYALWWLDHVPHPAVAGGGLQAGRVLPHWSDIPLRGRYEAWRGYYDDGYLSKFSRSGVTAVSGFHQIRFHGYPTRFAAERLKVPLLGFLPSGRAAAAHHHDPTTISSIRHSSGRRLSR